MGKSSVRKSASGCPSHSTLSTLGKAMIGRRSEPSSAQLSITHGHVLVEPVMGQDDVDEDWPVRPRPSGSSLPPALYGPLGEAASGPRIDAPCGWLFGSGS